jgi:Protein of unknown function (DUF4013)
MEGYEGLSDLLSNSIKYGLSNKRTIVIWGAVYLVTMVLFFAGYFASIFLIMADEKNLLAWAIMLLSMIPIIVMSVILFGFIRRCLSGLFEGDDTVPNVENLVGMVIDGLKISVIYLEGIVLMFIIFLPSMILMALSYRYTEAFCAYCLLYPVEMILMLLVLALNLVQWAVFADTGSLLSGLNPMNATRLIAGDLRYAAVAALAAFIVYLISSVVGMVLMLLIITILALPFVIIPFYCAGVYILARFYQHAKGKPRAT